MNKRESICRGKETRRGSGREGKGEREKTIQKGCFYVGIFIPSQKANTPVKENLRKERREGVEKGERGKKTKQTQKKKLCSVSCPLIQF